MSGSRFALLEKALGLRVPLELPDFDDDELSSAGDVDSDAVPFDEPVEPADILDPQSGVVWGGLMLPDSFPVLENACGDAILARFGFDGALRELVQWDHETCSWQPTDLVAGHEAPAAAAYRETRRALQSGLQRYLLLHGAQAIVRELEVPWPRILGWMNDTDTIEEALRPRVGELIGASGEDAFRQDWRRAAECARLAADARSDLSWPGAVLGRVAERDGDAARAARWYQHSLEGLYSSAGFTEVWGEYGTPYAAARLGRLQSEDPSMVTAAWQAGLDMLEVRERWMEQGRVALDGGDGARAYDCFFRAGWDQHFANDMEEVLEELARAADAAGSRALAALARLHLGTLSR